MFVKRQKNNVYFPLLKDVGLTLFGLCTHLTDDFSLLIDTSIGYETKR